MPHIRQMLRTLIGLCACLLMSGCFQGYGEDVSSPEELERLLLSLTPNGSQPEINTPIPQATLPPIQSTTIQESPTTEDIEPTNEPIIVEGGTIIHIVAEGETLFGIAQQYGVTMEALTTLNAIDDPNSVFVNQALIIPNPTLLPENEATSTEESTQTSNLPTATLTPLPTDTLTPTHTPTPTLTITSSATPIPTLTPSATSVALSTETETLTPTDVVQLEVSEGAIHIVSTGETLFRISQTYEVDLDDLALMNGIDDASQVVIGQALRIPISPISDTQPEATLQLIATETDNPPENPTPEPIQPDDTQNLSIHIVSTGETLYRISLDYGVTLDALALENGINDTSQVIAGQALTIPIPTPRSIVARSDASPLQSVSTTTQARIAVNIPTQINGVLIQQIVQISPDVERNMLTIYQKGQELGRNPRAFSKLGDSTIENPHFLARFDNWQGFEYILGNYDYLQAVIDYYAGSFIRQGAAVRRGMHSWTVFDPQWADKAVCAPNESALACEFRLQNPSILLVRLGANDVGVPKAFETNLREIIQYSIENGVIPVLGTKADRNDGASNPNNLIIRRLAEEYELPLWDFDVLANTLPGRGLMPDGVHMTINFSHDYTDPNTYRTGHGMHNLSALIMLDTLWQTLAQDIG